MEAHLKEVEIKQYLNYNYVIYVMITIIVIDITFVVQFLFCFIKKIGNNMLYDSVLSQTK